MAYYQGKCRQRGGGGLGSMLSSLARYIIPSLGRTAGAFVKSAARRSAPKLARAGLHIVRDLATKQNLKQALKKRGSSLITEMIKDATNANLGHSKIRKKGGRTKKKRPPPRKNKNGNKKRDIFD